MEQFITLKHVERSRTYHYDDGSSVTFHNINRLRVTRSGHHCLELEASNQKRVVAPGWRYISLDVDDWSF